MAMIVSLFCSQMSDIPEGWSWVVQAGWEGLIWIANGCEVLCLLCVSILETIRRIKALSWRDGTAARWASLCLAPCPGFVHIPHPPTSTISSLLILSCWCDCRVYRSSSARTQLEKARQKAPLNLVHSIICSAALLSHSWEILNTLYDNESTADRHKYHNGLNCLVRFAPNTNLSLITWFAESLEAELLAFLQEQLCIFF